MNAESWYYTDGENSIGPFSRERLQALHAAEIITNETLVCQAGGEWICFSEGVGPAADEANTASPDAENGTDSVKSDSSQHLIGRTRPNILVGSAVAVLILIAIGLGMLSFAKKRGTAVKPEPKKHRAVVKRMPSREDFAQALSSTRIVASPPGTIIIQDGWGQNLVVNISLYPTESGDNKPAVPEGYELSSHFNSLNIDQPGGWANEPNMPPPITLVQGDTVSLQRPPDKELMDAINTLIDWSIAAVTTNTRTLKREINPESEANTYVFYCDMNRDRFNLVQETPLSASQSGAFGQVFSITDYNRSHLWKYLFDHYDEVNALAAEYLAVSKHSAEIRLAETNAAGKRKREELDRQEQAEKAATDQVDRVFQRPDGKSEHDAVVTPAPTPLAEPSQSPAAEPITAPIAVETPPATAQPVSSTPLNQQTSAPQPTPRLHVVPGDEVVTVREERLFFKDQPERKAEAGQKFVVAAQRPDLAKVFVMAKNGAGQDIALSVAEAAVSAVPVDVPALLRSAIQAGEAGSKAVAEQFLARASNASPTEPAVAQIREALVQFSAAQNALSQAAQSAQPERAEAARLRRNAQVVDRPNPFNPSDTSNQERAQQMRQQADQLESGIAESIRTAEEKLVSAKQALRSIVTSDSAESQPASNSGNSEAQAIPGLTTRFPPK